MTHKLLLTVNEAACELECPAAVVEELVRLGELTALPLPVGDGSRNSFRLLMHDIEDFIVRGTPQLAGVLHRLAAAVRENRVFPEPETASLAAEDETL